MAQNRNLQTIAAIATPAGSGGLAVIRISGSEAAAVLSRIFLPMAEKLPQADPRRMLLGKIIEPQTKKLIDEGLAVFFAAPASFTTEDVAELHCHGGAFVAAAVLKAALAAGAVLAKPGEFTLRAFLGGRLDLVQAEAIRDIIEAKSLQALAVSQNQLAGHLSEQINLLEDELLQLLAEIAAGVDFPEDIDLLSNEQIDQRLALVNNSINELLKDAEMGRLLKEGVSCALLGAVNVGKSSLLNALLQEERVIVTASPGTTRDIVEEGFLLSGIKVVLADTAGLRVAKEEAEQIGIEKSRKKAAEAELLLLVFDATRPLGEQDKELLSLAQGKKALIIINKCDFADNEELAGQIKQPAPQIPIMFVSAKTGRGLSELKAKMTEIILGGVYNAEPKINNLRHQEALLAASFHMSQAQETLRQNLPADLAAVDILSARNALGEISGRTASADIIEKIFATFCLGK